MALALAPIAILGGITLGLTGAVPPFTRAVGFTANSLLANNIPDPDAIVDLRWRRLIDEGRFKAWMGNYGYDNAQSELLFQQGQGVLTLAELTTLYRRGLMPREQLNQFGKRLHYTEQDVDRFLQATELIAGPQELIRFAVREIFTPELRKQFGMDEEFPEEFALRAEQLGMSEKVAREFWAAHWELPSVGQATEMFHRLREDPDPELRVTEETFSDLLKAQDVMPYWRQRFQKVLFALPTRIDIRAMYRDGHIDEKEMLSLYKQLGYDDKNALLLTQLGTTYYKDEDRQLSRALVTKALRVGEISQVEALNFLKALNYSHADSELIVKLEMADQEEKELDDHIKVLTNQYVKGVIDEPAFTQKLDVLQLPSVRRDRVIMDADTKKQDKFDTPSVSDTRDFFKDGIIDRETAETYLLENGVRPVDVPHYFELWGAKEKKKAK